MMLKLMHLTRRQTILAVVLISLLALAVRLDFAPMEGLGFDVGTNQGWGRSAVELGLARSYTEQVNGNMLPNYPPLGIMIFAAAGHTYHTFVSDDFDAHPIAWRIIIKLPAIFADIATGILFFFLVGRWRGRGWGLVAAFAYALHPAAIYNSAVWGQTDAIFTFFLVATLAALTWKQWAVAGAMITLSLLCKAQGILLVPLVAFVLVMRPKALLSAFIASLGVLNLVLLPYAIGGSLPAIWNVYVGSVGFYPIVSSAAYNFWWSLMGDAAGSTDSTHLLFNVISYRTAGLVLFGSVILSLLALHWRRLRLRSTYENAVVTLFLLAAIFADAFFLFNTEMHERYLFPFVALGFPIAFLGATPAFIYGFVCLLFWFNMMGYLPFGWFDRGLYEAFQSLDILIASGQVFLFILLMRMAVLLAFTPLPSASPAGTKKPRTGRGSSLLLRLHALFRRKPRKTRA